MDTFSFASEWSAGDWTTEETTSATWQMQPQYSYEVPRSTASGPPTAWMDTLRSRQIVIECYAGGSTGHVGGSQLVGRCHMSMYQLFTSQQDRAIQLSLRDEGEVVGQLFFTACVAQVKHVELALAHVALTPNPLPLLLPYSAMEVYGAAGDRMRGALALEVLPSRPATSIDTMRADTAEGGAALRGLVSAEYYTERTAQWAQLPHVVAQATQRELVERGLTCRLYYSPYTNPAGAAATSLVPIGEFYVPLDFLQTSPSDQYDADDAGHGVPGPASSSSSSFHTAVRLVHPVEAAHAGVQCWARGLVEVISGAFEYTQPGARRARLMQGSPPPPPPSHFPLASREVSRSPLKTTTAATPPPGSGSALVASNEALLNRVTSLQTELAGGIRGRLVAVQEKKRGLAEELERVRAAESSELHATAEARSALEEDLKECLRERRAIEEELANVRRRKEELTRAYAARDAERRLAIQRVAEEKVEVVHLQEQLIEMQREMQGRLRREESQYESRVQQARATAEQAQREGDRWLTEVEARIAAAERAVAAGSSPLKAG